MANKETTFTFRVDAELKDTFVKEAQRNDRPASLLLRDFMREYVKQSKQPEGRLQDQVLIQSTDDLKKKMVNTAVANLLTPAQIAKLAGIANSDANMLKK